MLQTPNSEVLASSMTTPSADAAGFASCSWPIWQIDDFTHCFQRDYLKILLPLIIVSLSVLLLAAQAATRAIKPKHAQKYKSVPIDDNANQAAWQRTDLPPEDQLAQAGGDQDAEDDEEDLHMGNGGRLALAKTTTKGSLVQADTPPGQKLSIVVEELAIAGLVAVNVIALAYGAYGAKSVAAIMGTITWVYVLVLATLRLFLGDTKYRIPHLWNHTASIYALQWLFTIVFFRSVLIHPPSRLVQILVIIDFSLTTLLFGMAITTRKGNKTVLLEWEDDVQPSREPLASLLSNFTFGWVDAIVWQGYKQPLEMKDVWNLLPKDKAATILGHYRQVKKTYKLALHLLIYFKGMLIAQILWSILSGVFTFAPTLLLRSILEYVENPNGAPINVLWLYVVLLPISDIVRSIGDNQALWIGRKICINVRAILIGEIYAKSLRRKAASGKDSQLGKKKTSEPKDEAKKGALMTRVKNFFGFGKNEDKKPAGKAVPDGVDANAVAKAGDSDEQANLGTIINLMSVDSFKVSEVTAYLHFISAAAPVQLITATVLLYDVLGLAAIPGFIVMAALLPINIAFGMAFNSTQRAIMTATDGRIHITNEVLQNIRVIKYFAWEQRFAAMVDEKRKVELKALRKRFIIWSIAVAVWNSVPVVIMFFCFLVYTYIQEKPLYPSVAFTAISLFLLLRFPLDQLGDMIAHVQESKVSVDRIEEFLSEEETDKFVQLGKDNIDESGKRVIGIQKATFIWGSKEAKAEDGSMAFRLLDIDVDFKIGKLNIITGPTGSGKTSLLMALLGEMTLMQGKVFLPNGQSREDVRVDPATGLGETCAYVAQSAWLVNASIKDNIVFSAPFDEKRYNECIIACALERDLDILDHGDETLVGEKGITLSGGQKQRISLARAVYSNSKHLLFDDCLSAVDSHTAKWIFSNCIKGPLMTGRTCILVTHNVPLSAPHADFVVIMDNGRISAQGEAAGIIASGKLGEEVQKSRPASVNVSRVPSRVPSSVGEDSGDTLIDSNGDKDTISKSAELKPKTKKAQKQDAMEEGIVTGAVKWPVIALYLQSLGGWFFWSMAVAVFAIQQLASVASNVWIKEWANQYNTESVAITARYSTTAVNYGSSAAAATYMGAISSYVKPGLVYVATGAATNATEFTMSTATDGTQGVNAIYYIAVLGVIGIFTAFLAFFRDLWVFLGSLTASWVLHNRLMESVTKAKFKFFDVTPLGQMMNRFSKDLEGVDQEVTPVAMGVMSCALGIVVTIVLIAAITPGFLIAGFFITGAYVFLGKFYLASSRDLKRLESVQRSPLFQQFGETLSGVTTIRAYGEERRFVRENLVKINAQLRPFIYLWGANRWLAFRTDILGDLVAFFAGVFVIISLGSVNAGLAGLSLSYAIGFAENMLWLVRLYSMNEQNMNSVERIKEYLEVEQEAEAINEKTRPAAEWPSKGAVEFVDYTTSYRKELDPVLRGLTFKIEAKEKVGIVGRTGAGKSSLALAIFRALEADKGKISIDNLDISQIGLRDLREAITIVPQDPTLFTGTIRSNLDPFGSYTDEQIFASLRRVQLIGADDTTSRPATSSGGAVPPTPTIAVNSVEDTSSPAPNDDNSSSTPPAAAPGSSTPTNKNVFLDLSSPVSESGNNLSQGQRQLLCLARAMLKSPSVLVMDEATASIDYATDTKIQGTIRELSSTIITIAHRLQTIVDYDKVLVLDKGEIVEYAHPWELMQKTQGGKGPEGVGVFRGMCDTSGDYEVLAAAAKKAWRDKFEPLVDVEGGGDDDGEEEGKKSGSGGSASGNAGEAGATPAPAPAEESTAAVQDGVSFADALKASSSSSSGTKDDDESKA